MILGELIKRKIELKESISETCNKPFLCKLGIKDAFCELEHFHSICKEDEDVTDKIHQMNIDIGHEGKSLAELRIRLKVLRLKLKNLQDNMCYIYYERDRMIVDLEDLKNLCAEYKEEISSIKEKLLMVNWTEISEEISEIKK